MHTLIENLPDAKKAFGFATKVVALILLALIICTCSGPRLMLGSQSLEKQTDYSSYSGKHARQIKDVMEYAILKIDGLDLVSCHQQKQLIKLLSVPTLDSESYRRLVQMQRRCLPIRSYQYPYTTHSFSNRYRMEWTDRKPNSHIEYPHPNSQGNLSPVPNRGKRSKGSIQQ